MILSNEVISIVFGQRFVSLLDLWLLFIFLVTISNYYQGEGGLGVLLKIQCNTSSYSGFCFFKFPTFLQ